MCVAAPHCFQGNLHDPPQGNGPHINAFKTACGSSDQDFAYWSPASPCRRPGARPGAHSATSNGAFHSAPGEVTPGAKPTAPAENLSKKLSQSNGVIHPKEVDPAIEKPTPNARDPNVVPPPGTSGGASAPQPK